MGRNVILGEDDITQRECKMGKMGRERRAGKSLMDEPHGLPAIPTQISRDDILTL